MEGERSPSVLASLKAAMLEAEAKAKGRGNKKSIYLGSRRWLKEYTGFEGEEEEGEEVREDEKKLEKSAKKAGEKDGEREQVGKREEKGEKQSRPYNFL